MKYFFHLILPVEVEINLCFQSFLILKMNQFIFSFYNNEKIYIPIRQQRNNIPLSSLVFHLKNEYIFKN